MKQIILVTDGCSNVGISPIAAAARALAEGIVVNVIGITDDGETGIYGIEEINEIARAGGGLSRLVAPSRVAQTMQMMTRKTMVHTIHDAVNRELRQIVGPDAALESMNPEQRSQVVQVIDDLAETSGLKVALLVDASASMRPKLEAVREAIGDLMLSLQARRGTSEIAVFHFPDVQGGREVCMDLDWTNRLANVRNLFYKINMKGTTPTGPALLHVVQLLSEERTGGMEGGEPVRPKACSQPGKDGMLSDYVV
ncbi:VWA domain-containing protein [Paenibacillus sp. J2TS4]|uniref:vWA domain-containing protein n=1 Tax=Paenibacillus sp. J2TS4 TaxID=2807194 RepID=UPI001B05BEEF|nr:VWA domain-containing protein [Paenibacillus sp. J2TS4]GIP36349.1 hypothetical protein J2TS4_55590 [Paenibacillus sp. J2TS4]